MHKHGPRDNPCSGSHQPPQPDSVRSVNIQSLRQSTSSIGANVASSPTCINSATDEVNHSISLNSDVIQHPVCSGPIRKRIPIKSVRVHVGNLVVKLINDVISHRTSVTCWSRLYIGFPSACLAKPSRGGKSRNPTSQIINQVQQYEAGVEISPALSTRQTAAQRCSTSAKTPEQQIIVATAAAKLEDGDVKGAVRILCSDDKLASFNTTT